MATDYESTHSFVDITNYLKLGVTISAQRILNGGGEGAFIPDRSYIPSDMGPGTGSQGDPPPPKVGAYMATTPVLAF